MELTAAQLREKINKRLAAAKERVKQIEEQLVFFDLLLVEDVGGDDSFNDPTKTTDAKETEASSVTGVEGRDDEESVGKLITETIRNSKDDFSVETIAKIVRIKFPSIPYKEISRKFAAKAFRLQKRGEIEVSRKGYGRTPHLYRRIIKDGEERRLL